MAYPSFLPVPTRDGYSAQPSMPVKRFQMDDSQYRSSRVSSRKPFKYSLTWRLTFRQFEMFEAWLEYEVVRATGYFDLPLAGKMLSVRPLTQPNVSIAGNKWAVSFDVEEIRAAPVIAARNGILPIWPAALPTLEKSDYTTNQPDAVTRSDIDNGLAEYRARFRQRRTVFGGHIVVDLSQRNTFWDFWQNTLINGACYFMAPFANGKLQGNIRARIIENPVESANGAWFNIALQFETVSAPILTPTEYAGRK